MNGVPGSETPVTSRGRSPVTTSLAWYQMFGTLWPRCMSFDISARPAPVRAPPTTQLLLPFRYALPASPAGGGTSTTSRTENTSAGGTGGGVLGSPMIGASQREPGGYSQSNTSGGSTRCA